MPASGRLVSAARGTAVVNADVFQRLHQHTGVHTAILELAALEGKYAAAAASGSEALKGELSQRVQVAIHDLVLQAAAVGLAEGWREGVKELVLLLTAEGGFDGIGASASEVAKSVLAADRVWAFVHLEAFRGF